MAARPPGAIAQPTPRPWFAGSVVAFGLRADPLPPPVLPRAAVMVQFPRHELQAVQPMAHRAARGPDGVRARSVVVAERFRWPLSTPAIVWPTPTIERVLLPRAVVVSEAYWPRSLLLPVLVYRSAFYGSALPPAAPDPVFDAEPVPLTDRFRGDGWPVFRTGR